MAENLFKNSTCDIAPVPKADFDFVSDVCNIAPLPPPIYGCTAPVVPPDLPSDVGTECPLIQTISTVNVGFTGPSCEQSSSLLRIERTDVDPCKYDLALDLTIAVPQTPCTTISPGSFDVEVGYQDCITPTSTISIVPYISPGDCGNPDQCEFEINLDLKIPIPKPSCPQISITNFGVASGYSDDPCMVGKQNRFAITPVITPGDCDTADQCAFEVELEIAIPIPRPPCPVISITDFEVTSGFSDSTCVENKRNYFAITPRVIPGDCNRPARCEFDVELEILVPIPRTPCPALSVTSFSVISGYAEDGCATGDNRFEIITRRIPGDCTTPDSCEFDAELEIYIPIPRVPCPIINSPAFSVQVGYGDSNCLTGDNKFEITTRHTSGDCGSPGQCEFDVVLDIVVPIPRPQCPVINIGSFAAAAGLTPSELPPAQTEDGQEPEPDPCLNVSRVIVEGEFLAARDLIDCLLANNWVFSAPITASDPPA